MHFEILVEDQSGKRALDILVPRIIGREHTFKVHSYKGIGRIPKDLRGTPDPTKRFLLDQLSRLLRGYGKTFEGYPRHYPAAVIVVPDLDDRCLKAFRQELLQLLRSCSPQPKARFCIAIEEGEAWYMGDLAAIKAAYPHAKESVLHSYLNDSICGTWEKLADAVYPGGSSSLARLGWQSVGKVKSEWAERISPHMDLENNNSPSFCYFRGTLRELTGIL